MAATFVVEDGSGLEDANALVSVEEADQIIENYGNSSDWSEADEADKEDAIRQATRYMCISYAWKGWRVYDTQALQWPRDEVYDDEDWYINNDVVPQKVKEACAYLALKVIEGDTLLEDLDDEGLVKKQKTVVGPLTKEVEFVYGEEAGKTYPTADKLLAPYVESGASYGVDMERA